MSACAVLVLLGTAMLFHFPAWSVGLIPIEDDVPVFYFPLLVATSNALSNGSLVLWTPSIFGGYPLFADGESGMLYPLHLLILPWFAPEVSLVILRVLHSFLASLFTFIFIRTLGGRPASGVIGGLIYAYSGFAAGQIIHTNMFQGMVWLPLELALAERACQSRGWSRYRYAALAGATIGVQATAVHIHVVMMSAVALGLFLFYRGLTLGFAGEGDGFPMARRVLGGAFKLAGGMLIAGAILTVIGAIGIGLAAVQLLPLYELATQTARGTGMNDAHASINSIWPGGFLTLLLPRLFDTPSGGYWAPWVKWETTTYVGLLPPVLAGVAIVTRTGRHLWFFIGLAVVSILLALGPGAPVPLWAMLHELPGFDGLQSPGRFTLLFTLATAVLAAFGADWLARPNAGGVWRFVRVGLFVADGLLAVLAIKLVLADLSDAIRSLANVAPSPIEQFLHLPGIPGTVDGSSLSALRVAQIAADALSPLSQPAVIEQLVLATAGVLLVGLWMLGGALQPGRLRHAAAGLAVGLITADLLALALTFHPYGRITELRPKLPPVLFQEASGPYRVYTPSTAEDKRTQVEPNRLLVAGLQEANGYSSLQPDGHAAYADAIQYSDTQLLDLWNVRFLVRRIEPQLFPSYAGVSFHPVRPIVSGRGSGADEAVVPEGGDMRASQLRIISRLWNAADLPDGTSVAKVRVDSPDEPSRELEMLVGRDISDAAMDVPGTTRTFQHSKAEVAFQYQRASTEIENYGQQLYATYLALSPPMTVNRVTVHVTGPAFLEIFGMGLVDPENGEVTQARDKAKYRRVYQDHQIRVFENAQAMPRAFLVGNAIEAPPRRDVLQWMRDGSVDLRRSVILECRSGKACGEVPQADAAPASEAIGSARISAYSGDRASIQTTAAQSAMLVFTDPYFPGWVARVDGRPTTIFRADSLFRAVAVPAGEHTVTFSYEPEPLAIGGAATLGTAAFLLVIFAIPELDRLRRRAWTSVRWRSLRALPSWPVGRSPVRDAEASSPSAAPGAGS